MRFLTILLFLISALLLTGCGSEFFVGKIQSLTPRESGHDIATIARLPVEPGKPAVTVQGPILTGTARPGDIVVVEQSGDTIKSVQKITKTNAPVGITLSESDTRVTQLFDNGRVLLIDKLPFSVDMLRPVAAHPGDTAELLTVMRDDEIIGYSITAIKSPTKRIETAEYDTAIAYYNKSYTPYDAICLIADGVPLYRVRDDESLQSAPAPVCDDVRDYVFTKPFQENLSVTGDYDVGTIVSVDAVGLPGCDVPIKAYRRHYDEELRRENVRYQRALDNANPLVGTKQITAEHETNVEAIENKYDKSPTEICTLGRTTGELFLADNRAFYASIGIKFGSGVVIHALELVRWTTPKELPNHKPVVVIMYPRHTENGTALQIGGTVNAVRVPLFGDSWLRSKWTQVFIDILGGELQDFGSLDDVHVRTNFSGLRGKIKPNVYWGILKTNPLD